ncbi:F-box protein At3g07870-like [Aegilops tauschii subsp. strangulata]|uniref:Putative F-box protein n=2 Tax=Triticinae TaxID=1648030 RepID=R7W0G6_AEGTA|nr:F-box protein At3g22700-like [Aegilops tauschii subsp. strangulata]XP_044416600.1 F-box protein At3g22700-like [Triticum aestivum]
MADHRQSSDTPSSIPDDLIPEIISRLPARAVLRSRAICKLWRSIIDDDRFPHAHRRHQPHMPLLRLYRDGSLAPPELNPPHLRVRIEGIDLRARASQPVIRFAVAQEHKHAIESEEQRPRRDRNFRYIDPAKLSHPSAFDVHGSCDGVLLISHGWSIYAYNPATRCWADLPENDSTVIGFYVHRPSGNFHILLSNRLRRAEHWVFTMGHKVVQRRIPSPEFLSDQNRIRPACESPPALVSGNLHWLPQSFQSDRQLLAFDTVSETFRWMSPPNVDADGRALLELEGMLTMTVMRGERTVQLWVMPDYQQPAWFCKLLIEL